MYWHLPRMHHGVVKLLRARVGHVVDTDSGHTAGGRVAAPTRHDVTVPRDGIRVATVT